MCGGSLTGRLAGRQGRHTDETPTAKEQSWRRDALVAFVFYGSGSLLCEKERKKEARKEQKEETKKTGRRWESPCGSLLRNILQNIETLKRLWNRTEAGLHSGS